MSLQWIIVILFCLHLVFRGADTRVATSYVRMVPESTEKIESYLEKFVKKFFKSLPSTTIVCVSLLGPSYVSLLNDLTHCASSPCGWILLSHLNAEIQPAVLLLPLSTLPQGNILSGG